MKAVKATLPTHKVATAHRKAHSKITSDDKIAILGGQEHDEGGHAGHRLAHTWHHLLQRAHQIRR